MMTAKFKVGDIVTAKTGYLSGAAFRVLDITDLGEYFDYQLQGRAIGDIVFAVQHLLDFYFEEDHSGQ